MRGHIEAVKPLMASHHHGRVIRYRRSYHTQTDERMERGLVSQERIHGGGAEGAAALRQICALSVSPLPKRIQKSDKYHFNSYHFTTCVVT